MVDHTQSAVISASCLPMSIIIVGVGHEDFKVDLANVVGCLVDLDVDDGGRGGCHPSGWGALEELFHLIVPHWCRWRPRSAAQGVHGVLEGVGDISWGLRARWGGGRN